MNYPIKVPHVGEGIKFVQILRLLRQEGEWVEEDSGLIEIETDKTTFEIPSSSSGYISNIRCKAGDTIHIGEILLEISQEKPIQSTEFARNDTSPSESEVIANDSTRHLTLSPQQRRLAKNLIESQAIVTQAFLEKRISWSIIRNIRLSFRKKDPASTPSHLALITSSCAQAMFKHDKFRSKLTPNLELSTSSFCTIGIAESQSNDDLLVYTVNFNAPPNLHQVIASLRDSKNTPRKEPL